MKQIQVLLIEDHDLIRAGIKALLDGMTNVSVVAETKNEIEAISLARKYEPDVILDVLGPQIQRIDFVRDLVQLNSPNRVMILSLHGGDEIAWQALQCGVAAFINEKASVAELQQALAAVARGQTFLSPAISKNVIGDYARRQRAEENSLKKLTPRQQEVLQLTAHGLSSREIARKLNISVRTVETHRFQLMERLNIRNLAGLVRFAMQNGLVRSKE